MLRRAAARNAVHEPRLQQLQCEARPAVSRGASRAGLGDDWVGTYHHHHAKSTPHFHRTAMVHGCRYIYMPDDTAVLGRQYNRCVLTHRRSSTCRHTSYPGRWVGRQTVRRSGRYLLCPATYSTASPKRTRSLPADVRLEIDKDKETQSVLGRVSLDESVGMVRLARQPVGRPRNSTPHEQHARV